MDTNNKGPEAPLRPIASGQARSTGPRTEQGKSRAALNAVKWGLGARNVLLPGEDSVVYEQRLDALFQSLAPKNEGEAQLVAVIGDLLWRLERAAKIERGLMLGRIEEVLAQTDAFACGQKTAEAIQKVGSALTLWEVEPIPTSRNDEYDRRYRAMMDAVCDLGEKLPDSPLDDCAQCHELLVQLNDRLVHPDLPREFYAKVDEVARVMMGKLIDRGVREEAQQQALREAIAGISLPEKTELVKLGKYTATLEISLSRSLQALEHLRRLSESTLAMEAERAKEFRLRLRIVA
jgi:hypothetical protein